MAKLELSVSTETKSCTFSDFFYHRQAFDNESDFESFPSLWQANPPSLMPCMQKEHTSCETISRITLLNNFFRFFSQGSSKSLDELNWSLEIKKLNEGLREWLFKNFAVEQADTAAEEDFFPEIITETLKSRKRLSFSQAKQIALNAIENAEKKRKEFAEQEATITSLWEVE